MGFTNIVHTTMFPSGQLNPDTCKPFFYFIIYIFFRDFISNRKPWRHLVCVRRLQSCALNHWDGWHRIIEWQADTGTRQGLSHSHSNSTTLTPTLALTTTQPPSLQLPNFHSHSSRDGQAALELNKLEPQPSSFELEAWIWPEQDSSLKFKIWLGIMWSQVLD